MGDSPILYEIMKKNPVEKSDEQDNIEKNKKSIKLYNDRDSDEYWDYLFKQAEQPSYTGRKLYNDKDSDEYWDYLTKQAEVQNRKYSKSSDSDKKNKDEFVDISDLKDIQSLFDDNPENNRDPLGHNKDYKDKADEIVRRFD